LSRARPGEERRAAHKSGWSAGTTSPSLPIMSLAAIDDVLRELDEIVAVSRQRGSADGFFAALYRRTTAEVKRGIERGAFVDGERLARFDVLFAQRYLSAWHARERGEPTTAVWGVALGCDRAYWPVVLQHLLLGMNAHINLDLGISAAEIAPGAAIGGLQRDFDAVNGILASMVNDMQARLATIWPAMRWLDRSGGELDEAVINFSIQRARTEAWSVAQALAAMPAAAEREAYIRRVDDEMAALGRRVLRPGVKLSMKLALIRMRERGTVADKIDVLFR
jgi:hypothetical protein